MNETKLIKHVKRNGHITKNIMAIALFPEYDAQTVKRKVAGQLRLFPLSSNKMVYEDGFAEIEAKRGKVISDVVMEACLEHDKRGLEQCNAINVEFGLKPDYTEWGRYKLPKKAKAKK